MVLLEEGGFEGGARGSRRVQVGEYKMGVRMSGGCFLDGRLFLLLHYCESEDRGLKKSFVARVTGCECSNKSFIAGRVLYSTCTRA